MFCTNKTNAITTNVLIIAMNSPEELLAVLVPPDAVDWLDAGVLAVQYGVLPVHPVLRHLHAGDRHRGVGRGRVQSYETIMFSRNSDVRKRVLFSQTSGAAR